jgi:hypothetical protein
MQESIEKIVAGMFWDMPEDVRQKNIEKILNDPEVAFQDEHIFIKALNSLKWYDLVNITGGIDKLYILLNNVSIERLFPLARQRYYQNAKRLLSKYTVSATE